MKVTVKTTAPSLDTADALVLPLVAPARGKGRSSKRSKAGGADEKKSIPVPRTLRELDAALGGVIAAALASADFRAESGQTAVLYPTRPAGGRAKRGAVKVGRVVLVGLGAAGAQTPETVRRAAGTGASRARAAGARRVSVLLPALDEVDAPAAAQAATEGVVLAAYSYDRYRSNSKAPASLQSLTLYGEGPGAKTATGMRRPPRRASRSPNPRTSRATCRTHRATTCRRPSSPRLRARWRGQSVCAAA